MELSDGEVCGTGSVAVAGANHSADTMKAYDYKIIVRQCVNIKVVGSLWVGRPMSLFTF